MDKNKIAALLESLCERPFGGESRERPHDLQDTAAPGAQPRMRMAGEPMAAAPPAPASPAPLAASSAAPGAAELAAILSGTAADAHAQAFQAAATQSAAVRLDAQSALAFVDDLDQAPLAAPPGLVDEVLAAPPDLRRVAARRPGIWTRWLGAPRRQAVAALALLLMAAGVSWPLLRQDTGLPVGASAPPAAMPKIVPATAPFDSTIGVPPGPPAGAPILAAPTAPAPPALVVPAPPAVFGPRSVEAPARAPLALADPCAPREAAKPAAAAQTASRGEAAKRAPSAAKTAAVEPACPPDQARGLAGAAPAEPSSNAADNLHQPADQGTVRASSTSRAADRDQPTTAAPLALPRPRPASPTLAPNAYAPAR